MRGTVIVLLVVCLLAPVIAAGGGESNAMPDIEKKIKMLERKAERLAPRKNIFVPYAIWLAGATTWIGLTCLPIGPFKIATFFIGPMIFPLANEYVGDEKTAKTERQLYLWTYPTAFAAWSLLGEAGVYIYGALYIGVLLNIVNDLFMYPSRVRAYNERNEWERLKFMRKYIEEHIRSFRTSIPLYAARF